MILRNWRLKQENLTIKQLNNLENFQYPSVSYSYLEKSKNQLEANVLLNPKRIGFLNILKKMGGYIKILNKEPC